MFVHLNSVGPDQTGLSSLMLHDLTQINLSHSGSSLFSADLSTSNNDRYPMDSGRSNVP